MPFATLRLASLTHLFARQLRRTLLQEWKKSLRTRANQLQANHLDGTDVEDQSCLLVLRANKVFPSSVRRDFAMAARRRIAMDLQQIQEVRF